MRDSCARVRASLGTLPAGRLREEAALIVESVARHVAFAALQRSLLVWALAPLILVLFVFWSVHWHLRIVLCGASAGTIELARLRLRRKLLEPLVQGVVGSI
jgi:hypothetical protein